MSSPTPQQARSASAFGFQPHVASACDKSDARNSRSRLSVTSFPSELDVTMTRSHQTVNCVIVGGPKVGKTSLANQILKKISSKDDLPPINTGHPSLILAAAPNGTNYQLSINDIPSPGLEDESYISMLEGAEIILLCFSHTDARSFAQLEEIWVPFVTMLKIHQYLAPNAAAAILGTKCDLREAKTPQKESSTSHRKKSSEASKESKRSSAIKSDQIKSLVDQLGADGYIETSTVTGKGISKIVEEVISKPVVRGRCSTTSAIKIPNVFLNQQPSASSPLGSRNTKTDSNNELPSSKSNKKASRHKHHQNGQNKSSSKRKKCNIQ